MDFAGRGWVEIQTRPLYAPVSSEVGSIKLPRACGSQLPNVAPYLEFSPTNRLICRSLSFSAELPSQDPDAKPSGVLQAQNCSVLAEVSSLQAKPVPGFPPCLGVSSRKRALAAEEEKGAGWAKGANSCVLHGEDPQNSKAHAHCRPWPRMLRVAL